MGPAPMTITLSPGADARAGDPVQRHGQRLGQRGLARRQTRRQRGAATASPHQHVAGEGAVVAVDDRTLAVLALRRLPLEAAPAATALGRGAADHGLADLPAVHPLAQRGDGCR